jgi:hypothetical protein
MDSLEGGTMRKRWFIGAVVLGLTLGGHLGIAGAQDQPKPKKLNPYTGNQEAIKEGRQKKWWRRDGRPDSGI